MASEELLCKVSMILLGLLMLAALGFTDAQIGVNYGRLGNGLPPPSEVVALFKENNIQRMRIFDPYQPTLQALAGSNIELTLGVSHADLQGLAASQDNANKWVETNVKSHPNVKFKYIGVGNEISPFASTAEFVPFVFPAMTNIQNAISAAGLGNNIKVTTVIETGLITNTFPPSNGEFKPEARPYLDPIIKFLVNNKAPLLVNIYPYFAYAGNPGEINLDYTLFKSQQGTVMPDGVRYQNLFHAMLDAAYSAVEKAGGSSLEIVVSETGWPSDGGKDTSVENAKTYNTNLIEQVKKGTPKRPGKPIETYIFAMFDEDQKTGPAVEPHWGLFFPNKQHKYPITF